MHTLVRWFSRAISPHHFHPNSASSPPLSSFLSLSLSPSLSLSRTRSLSLTRFPSLPFSLIPTLCRHSLSKHRGDSVVPMRFSVLERSFQMPDTFVQASFPSHSHFITHGFAGAVAQYIEWDRLSRVSVSPESRVQALGLHVRV